MRVLAPNHKSKRFCPTLSPSDLHKADTISISSLVTSYSSLCALSSGRPQKNLSKQTNFGMMSEIMALSATADAALVPLFCITRETDSNLASNDVKGPLGFLAIFFLRPVLLRRIAGKKPLCRRKNFSGSFPICIRLIVDKLFKPSVPSTWRKSGRWAEGISIYRLAACRESGNEKMLPEIAEKPHGFVRILV